MAACNARPQQNALFPSESQSLGDHSRGTFSSTTVLTGELLEASFGPTTQRILAPGKFHLDYSPKGGQALKPRARPQPSTTPAAASAGPTWPPGLTAPPSCSRCKGAEMPADYRAHVCLHIVLTQGPCPRFGATWADAANLSRTETRHQGQCPLYITRQGACIRTCWTRPEPPPDAPRTKNHDHSCPGPVLSESVSATEER